MHLVLLAGLPKLPEDEEKTGSQIVAANHTARSLVLFAVASIAGLVRRTPRIAPHLLRHAGLGSALCIVAATHTARSAVLLAVGSIAGLQKRTPRVALRLLRHDGLGSALCIVAATHTTHSPVLLAVGPLAAGGVPLAASGPLAAGGPLAAVGPLEWHTAPLASHLLQLGGLVATARRTIPTATARPVAPSPVDRNVVI